MFSHFLRKIEDHFIKELPFVVYRKGGQDEITAVFQTENKLHHLKNYRESGFVFAPFNDDKSPIVLKTDEVRKINHPIKPSGPYQKVQHPKIDEKQKNFHLNLIEKGMKEIQRGRLKKVVLSRALEVNNNQKPLVLFTELLVLYPNAFCYVWYHPKVGMWLGATPETLLQLENRKLTTMSLAGTLPVV
ncbi:MAG: chorismate-binding protein, partial [Bacteroidota bacterium]